MKKIILLIILTLCLGYFYKDEIFFLNIYEKYFVIDYFTISIYISELLGLTLVILFISKKVKTNKSK